MSKSKVIRIALICVVCLLTCLLCGFTSVSESVQSDDRTSSCTDVSVFVNDLPVSRGYKIDDITFMSLTSFCEALGFQQETEWDEDSATLTVRLDGMKLVYHAGDDYMQANDRYIYLEGGVYKLGEAFIFPVRSIAKAFNVEIFWDEKTDDINMDTSEMEFLIPGSEFYQPDDVYWLSRIINAEAGNQSLDGKIGVGNVVLNRVESPSCPDTIYDVIFDTRYGVQFSPVETGAIYCEPNEESVVAAKLCLEGYETVGASLFFLNPDSGSSNWFASTRTFIVTIGNHDFYA